MKTLLFSSLLLVLFMGCAPVILPETDGCGDGGVGGKSTGAFEFGGADGGTDAGDCQPPTAEEIAFCTDTESLSKTFSPCEQITSGYKSCWPGLKKGGVCCCHTGTCNPN